MKDLFDVELAMSAKEQSVRVMYSFVNFFGRSVWFDSHTRGVG